MKTCLLCPNEIPATIKIDGKKRNLKNRKYCFECSPFGEHNTKPLHTEPANKLHKLCRKCNTVKELVAFYNRRNKKEPSVYCKSCTHNTTIDRQRNLKQQSIDYKGGKCCICGYANYNGALDFHHIDPSKKEFSIARSHLTSFDKVKSELDKCVLLCRNCHAEIHGGIVNIPREGIEPPLRD